MKKSGALFFMAIFAITLAGCTNLDNTVLEDSLEDILDNLYAYENLSEDALSFADGLSVRAVTSDNAEFHLGSDRIRYDEAISFVPAMSTTPFELTLIRTRGNQDPADLISDIEDNVDPQKWVSFGVDPSNVIVDNIGDVVILIMSDNFAHELHEAFLSLDTEPLEPAE